MKKIWILIYCLFLMQEDTFAKHGSVNFETERKEHSSVASLPVKRLATNICCALILHACKSDAALRHYAGITAAQWLVFIAYDAFLDGITAIIKKTPLRANIEK